MPISIDLNKDASVSSKLIILQIDNKSWQVSASKALTIGLVVLLCFPKGSSVSYHLRRSIDSNLKSIELLF